MALATKDMTDPTDLPIGWAGAITLDCNRDLLNRLAERGYTAEQIGRLTVAQGKAILGDNIEALISEDHQDRPPVGPVGASDGSREQVDAIQAVKAEAESAAKDAAGAAGKK